MEVINVDTKTIDRLDRLRKQRSDSYDKIINKLLDAQERELKMVIR